MHQVQLGSIITAEAVVEPDACISWKVDFRWAHPIFGAQPLSECLVTLQQPKPLFTALLSAIVPKGFASVPCPSEHYNWPAPGSA